jgi:hypothetical protein
MRSAQQPGHNSLNTTERRQAQTDIYTAVNYRMFRGKTTKQDAYH